MSRRSQRRHHKSRILNKHRSRARRTCWPADVQEKVARRRVQHHSRHVWKEDRSWWSEKNRLKVQERASLKDLTMWKRFEDPDLMNEDPMVQFLADLYEQTALAMAQYLDQYPVTEFCEEDFEPHVYENYYDDYRYDYRDDEYYEGYYYGAHECSYVY